MSRVSLLLLILVVLSSGIAIRIYFAFFFGFDWDASILLYQAQLASQGAIMFSQIRAEDPFYVYLLALMLPLFGSGIWIFKGLSIVSSLVIAAFVYLIGKELFGRRIGIISIFLYLLIPVVAIFDVQGTYRTVFQVPVMGALYLELVGLRSRRPILLVVGGLLVGISVFLYAGSVFYALLLLTIPFVYQIASMTNKAKNLLNIFLGLLIGLGSGILLLLLLGSTLGLIESGWFPSIAVFATGTGGTGGRFSDWSSFANYLEYMTRYLYVETRDWIPLISLAIIYFFTFVVSAVRTYSYLKKVTIMSALLIVSFLYFVAAVVGMNIPPHGNYGLFDVSSQFDEIFLVEVLVLLFLIFLTVKRSQIRYDKNPKVMIVWIMWLLGSLVSFELPHGFYFQFFAAPLCILGGYTIKMSFSHSTYSIRKQRRLVAIILVLFLSVSSAFAGLMFLNSNINEWTLTAQQVSQVGTYLRMHTSVGQYVFTAAPVYAVAAGRPNAGNLDNYFYFVNKGTTNINYSQTVIEIYNLMRNGAVKYIILDPFGRTEEFLKNYPLIQSLFQDDYKLATSIDDVSIWQFQRGFSLSTHLNNVSAYTGAGPYTLKDQVWYYENDSIIFSENPNDKNSYVQGIFTPGQIAFEPPRTSSSGQNSSFIKMNFGNDQYSELDVSYSLPDSATSQGSGGVRFEIMLGMNASTSYKTVINATVDTNYWSSSLIDLTPYQGKNLTVLLVSTSLSQWRYSWLQLSLNLYYAPNQ